MKKCIFMTLVVFFPLLTGCKPSGDPLTIRTIDEVVIGNMESELAHDFDGENFRSGAANGGNWRDARGDNGGYYRYTLKTGGKNNLILWVRYWGNDQGNRSFNIFIDDKHLADENISGKWNEDTFYNLEYRIPADMVKSRKNVVVKFQSTGDNIAGGIYGLRMLGNK